MSTTDLHRRLPDADLDERIRQVRLLDTPTLCAVLLDMREALEAGVAGEQSVLLAKISRLVIYSRENPCLAQLLDRLLVR